eukprot:181182_1
MGLSRLSRRNTCIVYLSSLIATLGIVAAFHSIANIVLCSLLAFCIFAASCVYLIPCCSNSKRTASIPTYNEDTTLEHTRTDDKNTSEVSVQVHPPLLDETQPSRLYYLDNIKSFLTIIVVMHHISGAFHGVIGDYYNSFFLFAIPFSTINQTYFMCLFFFISAYFTPTSCDRKGVRKFLSVKFKRLGIPFLCYTFIMGPSLDLLISQGVGTAYSYIPDPGPCWFLAWLLIFNVCYVIMDENVPFYVMKCPSLIRLTIYGAILGVIQLIVFILVGGSFIFMPITLGSLPFDIVFFTAGVIAKRNKWLSSVAQLSSFNVLVIRIMAVLCVFAWIGCCTAVYVLDMGFFIPKKDESETDCDTNDVYGSLSNVFLYLSIGFGFVFGGICCITFSVAMLEFAASYGNFANTFSTFLSKNAYTVYLIHPLVLVPATWTFTKLLKLFNGTEIIFCKDSVVSKTHFGGDYLVWVGFFYTICVTMLIVWPLAWCIRRIPGLDKII